MPVIDAFSNWNSAMVPSTGSLMFPALCFQQLMASDSKGAFFNSNIRNRFPYQLLTDLGQKN
jgi:hypothetical protein